MLNETYFFFQNRILSISKRFPFICFTVIVVICKEVDQNHPNQERVIVTFCIGVKAEGMGMCPEGQEKAIRTGERASQDLQKVRLRSIATNRVWSSNSRNNLPVWHGLCLSNKSLTKILSQLQRIATQTFFRPLFFQKLFN